MYATHDRELSDDAPRGVSPPTTRHDPTTHAAPEPRPSACDSDLKAPTREHSWVGLTHSQDDFDECTRTCSDPDMDGPVPPRRGESYHSDQHFGESDYVRVRNLVREYIAYRGRASSPARTIESVTDTVTRQVMNDLGVTVERHEARSDAEPQNIMSEAVLPAAFDRESAGGAQPLADAAPPRTCAPPALDEGSIPDRVAASATKTVLPSTSKRVVYRVTDGEREPTGRPDDARPAAACRGLPRLPRPTAYSRTVDLYLLA